MLPTQQVAEKALKAFLYASGEQLVLGNSVDDLLRRAVKYDGSLAEKREWASLDGYYIPTRYPNGLPDGIPAHVYTPRLARDAVSLATDVVESIARRLAATDMPTTARDAGTGLCTQTKGG